MSSSNFAGTTYPSAALATAPADASPSGVEPREVRAPLALARIIIRSLFTATALAGLILAGLHYVCVHDYEWIARVF